jgi:hypothetical protein
MGHRASASSSTPHLGEKDALSFHAIRRCVRTVITSHWLRPSSHDPIESAQGPRVIMLRTISVPPRLQGQWQIPCWSTIPVTLRALARSRQPSRTSQAERRLSAFRPLGSSTRSHGSNWISPITVMCEKIDSDAHWAMVASAHVVW